MTNDFVKGKEALQKLRAQKDKPQRADEEAHKPDLEEAEKEQKAKKKKEKTPKAPKGVYINKYGFLHVDKNLAKHLGVEFGKDKADVPVRIEPIECGFTVKLVKP